MFVLSRLVGIPLAVGTKAAAGAGGATACPGGASVDDRPSGLCDASNGMGTDARISMTSAIASGGAKIAVSPAKDGANS